MTIDVDGVYEAGVVRLEHPVALKDKTKVHVTIKAEVEPPADDDPTGWKAAEELIGIIKDAPPDMAENHDFYLYGRPRR